MICCRAGDLLAGGAQQQLGGAAAAGGGAAPAVGDGLGAGRFMDGQREALVEEERTLLGDTLALLDDVCPQVPLSNSAFPLSPFFCMDGQGEALVEE